MPAELAHVRNLATFRALVRPYPVALTGTPTAAHVDPAHGTYDLAHATRGPDGRRYRSDQVSVVSVPELRYPDRYTVEVSGPG